MSEASRFQIRPVNDIPENDATLLGHDEIIENLKNFIESDNLITPISIAIHGDWGSGKTSIMNTLKAKLDNTKFKIVFFEAWRYEYSNPSLGLINEIFKGSIDANVLITILETAANIFLKQFAGIDIGDINTFVRNTRDAPESFTKHLAELVSNKLANKKLLVIIDDLDRCEPENALQLLALLKLFLDIKNVICISAVDFNRLQQAWHKKYGINDYDQNKPSLQKRDEGLDYLDKIFQLRIGIPIPSLVHVQEYLRKLLENPPNEIIEMISRTGPRNPREIKRFLNLISFRANVIENNYSNMGVTTQFDFESACVWTLLEENLGKDGIVYFYGVIQRNDLVESKTLASLILKYGHDWKSVKELLLDLPGNISLPVDRDRIRLIIEIAHEFYSSKDIAVEDIDQHFEILYNISNESKLYGY